MKDDVKDLDKLSDELVSRVESVLANAEPGPDRSAFETRFEDMKAKWADVKGRVNERQGEIDEQAPKLYNYHEKVEDFVTWLTDLESKLSSLGPVSCETKMIAKQLEKVESLNKDFNDHKPDYEAVKEIAVEVINSEPDDVYLVEAQLQYINKLWESVALRLKDRLDHINNIKEIAAEYQKAQRPVRALYAWAEDAVVSLETIGSDIEKAKQELNNTKVTHQNLNREKYTMLLCIGNHMRPSTIKD